MNQPLKNYLLGQGFDPRDYIVLGVVALSDDQSPLCTAAELVKFTEMANSLMGVCGAVIERELDDRLYFGCGVCFLRMNSDLLSPLSEGITSLSVEVPRIAEWLDMWQQANISRHPADVANLKKMEKSFSNENLVKRLKKFAASHATSATQTITFFDDEGSRREFKLPPLAQLKELEIDGTPAMAPPEKQTVKHVDSTLDIASITGDGFLVNTQYIEGDIAPGTRVRLILPSAPRRLHRIRRLWRE
ncbi:MAG: hypothetical protein QM769_00785 [Pseudoxanthomonas sp.]